MLIHHADPTAAAYYLDAYARLGCVNGAEITAWLTPVAAARLAEGVLAETEDLLRFAGLEPANG